jgi:hypothetical protein
MLEMMNFLFSVSPPLPCPSSRAHNWGLAFHNGMATEIGNGDMPESGPTGNGTCFRKNKCQNFSGSAEYRSTLILYYIRLEPYCRSLTTQMRARACTHSDSIGPHKSVLCHATGKDQPAPVIVLEGLNHDLKITHKERVGPSVRVVKVATKNHLVEFGWCLLRRA